MGVSLSLAQRSKISPLAAQAHQRHRQGSQQMGTITTLDKACAANPTATSSKAHRHLGSGLGGCYASIPRAERGIFGLPSQFNPESQRGRQDVILGR